MSAKATKPRMTRQQQLASKPLRLVDGDMTDGRLTVKIQQKHWSRWLLRLPKDATKTFELDSLGQMVWSLCDGKTSVQQIARKLAKTYNVSEREAQVATEKFLITLARKGLIGAAMKKSDP
jgi:Coenzyme PQQ synthesis protein D (PqqD)